MCIPISCLAFLSFSDFNFGTGAMRMMRAGCCITCRCDNEKLKRDGRRKIQAKTSELRERENIYIRFNHQYNIHYMIMMCASYSTVNAFRLAEVSSSCQPTPTPSMLRHFYGMPHPNVNFALLIKQLIVKWYRREVLTPTFLILAKSCRQSRWV